MIASDGKVAQVLPPEGPYNKDIVYAVPMEDIFADEAFNVRGAIQALEVMELAKDISNNGLNQPITIQPYVHMPGKKFRIVAGHRRHKAHELNRATHIRALVVEGLSDLDARAINLTENLHRKDLNIVQEANAIYHLKMGGWTQEEVAEKIGKSRGWVQTRYYVLDLPEEIKREIAAGLISQQQIKELWSLDNYELQIQLLKEIKDDKLLGRKKQSTADKVKPKEAKKLARMPSEIFELQEIVQDLMGVDHPIAIVMGWCAGVVDDKDVHEAIALAAKNRGRNYKVPEFAS